MSEPSSGLAMALQPGPIPVGQCQCGCGRQTRLALQTSTKDRTRKGQPRRYVYGHQPKGSSMERHPAWVGGRSVSPEGYVLIRMPDHPRGKHGYVLEHILIAECALGKPLPPKAQVHHVDENRANNARGNLVICEDDAYHKLLHRRRDALLACGDANAHRCEICLRYDNQADILVTTKGGRYHRAYHRGCGRQRCANQRLRRASGGGGA